MTLVLLARRLVMLFNTFQVAFTFSDLKSFKFTDPCKILFTIELVIPRSKKMIVMGHHVFIITFIIHFSTLKLLANS